MDGILLNKKIGIIGGGITGLIVGIFLAKEGHKVSIFEKNTLLSGTSSKTTKLLHGGLRYLENFHFNEVKNGLNGNLVIGLNALERSPLSASEIEGIA